MKYAYPAIFTQEDVGYSVIFPDIEGCATSGITLPEAMEMAEDALCLMLYDHEEDGEEIPAPSDIRSIQVGGNSIVSLVCCDTIEYRKLYDNKSVKKTLTIPAWLNTMAERAGVNFSLTLQTALKQELHIQ
jgi:predicted RNase H-like HicB family nuclease